MSKLEKILVNDAKPFKQVALDENVLEKLNRNISENQSKSEARPPKNYFASFQYKWLLPMAMVSVLVLFFNFEQGNKNKLPENSQLASINLDLNKNYPVLLMTQNFDQKLMSSLAAEKKALTLDLNNLKERFAL